MLDERKLSCKGGHPSIIQRDFPSCALGPWSINILINRYGAKPLVGLDGVFLSANSISELLHPDRWVLLTCRPCSDADGNFRSIAMCTHDTHLRFESSHFKYYYGVRSTDRGWIGVANIQANLARPSRKGHENGNMA